MSPPPRGPRRGSSTSSWSWLRFARLLVVLVVGSPFGARGLAQQPTDPAAQLAGLVAKIEESGDLVDPSLVHELAALGTREAFNAVVRAGTSFQTVYMRRAAIAALIHFAGRTEIEADALARLRALALERESRETSEAAVAALAHFRAAGHAQLRDVASRAPLEDVRELALREHAAVFEPADEPWYRELWGPAEAPAPAVPKLGAKSKGQSAGKGKATITAPPAGSGESDEPPVRAPTEKMREIAFDALSARLESEELTRAIADRNSQIASIALLRLEGKGDPRARALALARYESVNERASVRATAAAVVARADGKAGLARLIEDAGKAEMPRRLLDALAELVGQGIDAELEKRLARMIGKGSLGARLFALRALAHGSERKYDDGIAEQLDESEPELVLAAAEALARRGASAQAQALTRALARAKDGFSRAALIESIAGLLRDEPAWRAELAKLAADADPDVRNAAVIELGRRGGDADLALLGKLLDHEHWATRLAAVRGLELLHREDCVELLVARLSKEQGRLCGDIAAALQRMTGRSFGAYPDLWRNWWDKRPSDWRLAGSGAAPTTSGPRTEVREASGTRVANFFGARVTSERVLFLVDISGSMEEAAADGETRFEHASKKLVFALQNLSPQVQFNLIVFGTHVTAWRRELLTTGGNAAKEKVPVLERAKAWIEKLRIGGGTNLYGALEAAFTDREVDTIYLLTDGEPTQGGIIDPVAIRQRVALWNKHRGVVIHTIAFGSSFPLLEWLAGDSGGTYRYIP